MKFYPPDQLPPMRLPDEGSGRPPQTQSRSPFKQRAMAMVAALVIGATIAGVGFYLFSNAVWFAALPVAIVVGWFLAPLAVRSDHSSGGTVFW